MDDNEQIYDDLTVGQARQFLVQKGFELKTHPSTIDGLAVLYDIVKRRCKQ